MENLKAEMKLATDGLINQELAQLSSFASPKYHMDMSTLFLV